MSGGCAVHGLTDASGVVAEAVGSCAVRAWTDASGVARSVGGCLGSGCVGCVGCMLCVCGVGGCVVDGCAARGCAEGACVVDTASGSTVGACLVGGCTVCSCVATGVFVAGCCAGCIGCIGCIGCAAWCTRGTVSDRLICAACVTVAAAGRGGSVVAPVTAGWVALALAVVARGVAVALCAAVFGGRASAALAGDACASTGVGSDVTGTCARTIPAAAVVVGGTFGSMAVTDTVDGVCLRLLDAATEEGMGVPDAVCATLGSSVLGPFVCFDGLGCTPPSAALRFPFWLVVQPSPPTLAMATTAGHRTGLSTPLIWHRSPVSHMPFAPWLILRTAAAERRRTNTSATHRKNKTSDRCVVDWVQGRPGR